jgi:excisionase family DNA binding protein
VLLYTATQAAALLQVPESWLRRKAATRAIPCRKIGKHLRFTRADLDAITAAAAQPIRHPTTPAATRRHRITRARHPR